MHNLSVLYHDPAQLSKKHVLAFCPAWPYASPVSEGSRTLVLGANGSGKTALAHALAGLDSLEIHLQKAGTDLFCGAYKHPHKLSLTGLDHVASFLAYLARIDNSDFAEGGQDPGITPQEYWSSLGITCIPTSVLEQLSVHDIVNRGCKYLSSGELRKVLLLGCLFGDAGLVIIDSLLDSLDTASRVIASTLLASLDKRQTLVCLEAGGGEFFDQSWSRAQLVQPTTQARAQSGFAPLPTNQTDPPKSALIHMENIEVGWDGHAVIKDFSWTLLPGDHTQIIGPNGSGKSTLLGLITGECTQVYANQVWIFGTKRGSGESVWDIKARLGLVSQRLHNDYLRIGSVSVLDTVLSGYHDSIGLYQAVTATELERALAWLHWAGLEMYKSSRLDSLGYGEQRLVLIVRAIIKEPPLLLLDEPCQGLDDQARERIVDLIDEIARRRISTIVHVSHDPRERPSCIQTSVQLQKRH